MKQERAPITKIMMIVVMIIMALSHSLYHPVNALASPQQVRLSRGHNAFPPCSKNVPSCTSSCTPTIMMATMTNEATTPTCSSVIPKEIVERKVPTIAPRDGSQKQRSLSKTPEITGSQAWELRLYNDEDNFEFWVAEQLVKIVGLSEREAFDTMKLAGITGQATIGSYDCFELAEYYHVALQAEGLAVQLLPILQQSC